jgi:transcriptional regulator with XRE-family HTH domain
MPSPHTPGILAKRIIRKIGSDLKTARLRRRLTMEVVSARAFITRGTLSRVEKGDPAVGFGIYASVVQALGLVDRLMNVLADDPVGLELENEQLPKRVRAKKNNG